MDRMVLNLLNAVEAGHNMTEHLKECDICLNWAVSGQDGYVLTCLYGWGQIHAIRTYEDAAGIAGKHRK